MKWLDKKDLSEDGLYVSHLPYFGYGMDVINVVCIEGEYVKLAWLGVVDGKNTIKTEPLPHDMVFLGPLPSPPSKDDW